MFLIFFFKHFEFFSQISFLFFACYFRVYIFFANLVRMVIYTCCMFVWIWLLFVALYLVFSFGNVSKQRCPKNHISALKKCFRQHIDTIIETSAFYFDYIFLHHWWIMMHQTIYIITSEYNLFRCPICGKTFVNVWPPYFLMPL